MYIDTYIYMMNFYSFNRNSSCITTSRNRHDPFSLFDIVFSFINIDISVGLHLLIPRYVLFPSLPIIIIIIMFLKG